MFSRFARRLSKWSGHPITFCLSVLSIIVWGLIGPIFNFSEAWQMVVNTGTTIITFLLCFLIQNTQGRDTAAIQAKLDILIHALPKADNRFKRIEDQTEEAIEALRSS